MALTAALGGSKFQGPRQRPLPPLRAAPILKPPALPGDTYNDEGDCDRRVLHPSLARDAERADDLLHSDELEGDIWHSREDVRQRNGELEPPVAVTTEHEVAGGEVAALVLDRSTFALLGQALS